jgi:hypothetical protein
MPNPSRHADGGVVKLELSVTDLRAHFEAQLRSVKRAEQYLQRCRTALDAVAFDRAADGLRDQLTIVTKNRKAIGALLGQIVEDGGKLTFTGRPPKV